MSNLCDSASPAGNALVQKLKEQKCVKDKTDESNRVQELADDVEEGEYDEEDVVEEEDEDETSESVEKDSKSKNGILNPRVSLEAKFRPGLVKELIEQIVTEMLKGKEYSKVDAPTWTNNLTNLIMAKTKELNFERYKLVSYVVVGERKDEGVSSAHRCFWDQESDSAASYTFMNDSMFCTATVYAISILNFVYMVASLHKALMPKWQNSCSEVAHLLNLNSYPPDTEGNLKDHYNLIAQV